MGTVDAGFSAGYPYIFLPMGSSLTWPTAGGFDLSSTFCAILSLVLVVIFADWLYNKSFVGSTRNVFMVNRRDIASFLCRWTWRSAETRLDGLAAPNRVIT